MQEISLLATIHVKKEYREAALDCFGRLVPASRKEAGNRQYDLLEDAAAPGYFVMVERWASEQAIEEHNNSAHFQEFARFIEGKTRALDIRRMSKVLE